MVSANGRSLNNRLVEPRWHQAEVVITPFSLRLSDNRPTVLDSASHTRHLGREREKMTERFGILFVEKTQLVLTVKVPIKPEESC